MHAYEVRPRKDKQGVDLLSDALPFGRLWCGEPSAVGKAVGYVKFYSRSHNAVIRVYDAVDQVIETHEHAGPAEFSLDGMSVLKRKRDKKELACGICAFAC